MPCQTLSPIPGEPSRLLCPYTSTDTVMKGVNSIEGVTLTTFARWLAAKESSGALLEGPNVLTWIFKRTLNMIGYGGDEKRMKLK